MEQTQFDPACVSAAREGNQSALAQLYNATYQSVYLTIKSMCGGDEDTVLDLLQDTYLKAFDSLDQLKQPERFNAWIKAIARNKTLDELRKTRPVLFSELAEENDDTPEAWIEEPDVRSLPEAALDRQETARLIRSILDALPEGQRVVVSMYYYQGMKIREIAETLGRSESTVKVQLKNGRRSIEDRVSTLEQKEGIKLYGLSPLAFLLSLLRGADGWGLEPNAGILSRLLPGGPEHGGASGAGAAPVDKAGRAAAAKAAAGTASRGAAVKIIAGVLAGALVIGGGAAGFVTLRNEAGQAESDGAAVSAAQVDADSADAQETEDPLALAYAAYAQIYSDLEEQYGGYHDAVLSGEGIPYVAGVFYADLIDFTGDGIPELVLAHDDRLDGDQYVPYQIEVWSWNGTEAFQIYQKRNPLSGGDYADTRIAIGHKDGKDYLVVGQIAHDVYIEFLAWDGNAFASAFTLEWYSDFDDLGGTSVSYEYGIDGQAVTKQEYLNAWDEWWEDVETYSPYGMPESVAWGEESERTAAKQAIAETKTALGMDMAELELQAEDTSVISAPQTLEDVLEQYNALLNGTLSYYDFVGAEITYAEVQEGYDPIVSDYFLEQMNAYCGNSFNQESGYNVISEEKAETLSGLFSGGYSYAFADLNSDGFQELMIALRSSDGSTRELLVIWSMLDGVPVKVCSAAYRSPMVVCNNGVILCYDSGGLYDHTYTFYSFDALLDGTNEILEQHTIAYDDDIWNYTSFVDITSNIDWISLKIVPASDGAQ